MFTLNGIAFRAEIKKAAFVIESEKSRVVERFTFKKWTVTKPENVCVGR